MCLLASRPVVEDVADGSGVGVEGDVEPVDVEVGVARVASVRSVEGVSGMPKRRPFVGDRLLTVGEVAATMRVSNMTVYRLIKAGQLAAIRVGKNYRIRESDVNRYLSERSVRVEGEQ
jgi:excisionase family DNA binding protein